MANFNIRDTWVFYDILSINPILFKRALTFCLLTWRTEIVQIKKAKYSISHAII